jgi:alpha-ketoglutarate-dependent taurine dioxygenase
MLAKRLFEECSLPALVEPDAGGDLASFVQRNQRRIDDVLIQRGAILFRGFRVAALEDFSGFVSALSSVKMRYDYGSTPRTALGKDLYTATEYHCSLEIPLHNECSYQTTWPRRLALCCLTAPTEGGQTPLASMSLVSAAIGKEAMEEFERRQVKYVRHYHPYVDVPWQSVFGVDDRGAVSRICRESNITAEWLTPDLLRTVQVCQGVAAHPVTGEKVFFNQAHLFHPSRLGADNLRALVEVFGEDHLPRTAYFGDGAPIPDSTIEAIDGAFRRNIVEFNWAAGDVLLIDNMQVAHGRRAYQGQRKVVAALLDPMSAPSGRQRDHLRPV